MTRNHVVVVGYDFSSHAGLAFDRAIEVAETVGATALHVVTVLDRRAGYQAADRMREDLQGSLRAVIEARNPSLEIDLHVHTRIGNPAREILGVARDVGADEIILGSKGRSALGRLLLGSVCEGVLHGARCPVLVVRAKQYEDVELATVVDAPPDHHATRELPHRYSYTGGGAMTRPPEWPIN
jgi:nucleotide-binding universal stress UspA family protein